MLAKVQTFAMIGIEATPVEIEVDVAHGLPSVSIVGLPDSSVKESKERVRSGIKNSGFTYPPDKITINLAPSNIKKEGSSFDLAIALGILAASEQIEPSLLKNTFFSGELSLNGELREIRGALAMALALKKRHTKNIILPSANAAEASLVSGVKVIGIKTLAEVVGVLYNPESAPQQKRTSLKIAGDFSAMDLDFCEVKGQAAAKRALEVAASGRHNILMVGPPGSGKTMLAKRLITILPVLSEEEALETTKIHSSLGLVRADHGLIAQRPFRSPHHTISNIALAGGGTNPQPGEISLAHNGILFMDELPEFHRNALEVLRQPLEDGHIRVSRAARSLTFPAQFSLVAAMNPCPCGFYTDPRRACRCTPQAIARYNGKISGPLLDRIDIHIEMPALKFQELTDEQTAEPSKDIRGRVAMARQRQRERFQNERITTNAQMNSRLLKKYCPLTPETRGLIKNAMAELKLSARAFDKVLRVSRTIADLAGTDEIKTEHLAEAIQYRSLDRDLFTQKGQAL